MNATDVVKVAKHRPFQPFRVHLSDGRLFEVRHAELVMVSPTDLVLGIPINDNPLILCDHVEYLPLPAIDRLELLSSPESEGESNSTADNADSKHAAG